MQEPRVLISIVNWMNYWDTIECVSLCKKQAYANIEIVVVDNGSVNESVQKIKNSHPDIKLIETGKNLGFAGGHKKAYHYCKSRNFGAMWLMNPDARIFPDTLVKLVEAYLKYGKNIYGSITIDDKCRNLTIDQMPKGIAGFAIEKKEINDEKIFQTDFVSGASFFVPIKVFEKIGFISTKYFMYVEEVDFSYYAYRNNIFSYYVLDSKIMHEGEKSFEISEQLKWLKTYYSIRNYIYFTLKIKKYPRRVIRINNGGMRAIIKNCLQKTDMKKRYHAIGVLHAYLGIMGRYFNPQRFL